MVSAHGTLVYSGPRFTFLEFSLLKFRKVIVLEEMAKKSTEVLLDSYCVRGHHPLKLQKKKKHLDTTKKAVRRNFVRK